MVAVTNTVLHNIHLLIQYICSGAQQAKIEWATRDKITRHSNDANRNIVMQKVIIREIKVLEFQHWYIHYTVVVPYNICHIALIRRVYSNVCDDMWMPIYLIRIPANSYTAGYGQ